MSETEKTESTCDLAALLEQAELDESGDCPKSARNLRLAAAELWLRRKGKTARDSLWCLDDDDLKIPNALPANIFIELSDGVRFGGFIKTVRYKDNQSAWVAAIEATAKCLEKGTIEP